MATPFFPEISSLKTYEIKIGRREEGSSPVKMNCRSKSFLMTRAFFLGSLPSPGRFTNHERKATGREYKRIIFFSIFALIKYFFAFDLPLPTEVNPSFTVFILKSINAVILTLCRVLSMQGIRRTWLPIVEREKRAIIPNRGALVIIFGRERNWKECLTASMGCDYFL